VELSGLGWRGGFGSWPGLGAGQITSSRRCPAAAAAAATATIVGRHGRSYLALRSAVLFLPFNEQRHYLFYNSSASAEMADRGVWREKNIFCNVGFALLI